MKYGTILYQSNIKLMRFILLEYCFTEQNSNHSQTRNEASLPQENYINRTLSWICVKDYRKTRTKIGEEGVILEGDESMFGIDLEKMTISGNGTWKKFRMLNFFGNIFSQQKKYCLWKLGDSLNIFKKKMF